MRTAIVAAEWAMDRRAAEVAFELRRGVRGLTLVANCAPLLGFLLAARGILGSFVGCSGEKSMCMAELVYRLSNAQWPAAFGIGIALAAWWFRDYLLEQVAGFEVEMAGERLRRRTVLERGWP